MNVLFIGDIVGKCGRKLVFNLLPELINDYQIDFCIANIENVAGGSGITPALARQLLDADINVLTSGNHIWDKKEIEGFIGSEERLLRPANYPPGVPGFGSVLVRLASGINVGALNLAGRVFMNSLDCPFRTAIAEVENLRKYTSIIVVDFHAEATSEKIALGWYLDGKVSAVIGTHTHVQTADCKILPKGTGYITDAGMTGGFDSVIGVKKEQVLKRFLQQTPVRFEPSGGDARLCGLFLKINEKTGCCTEIKNLQIKGT